LTSDSLETRYSWIAASLSVLVLTMSYGSFWIIAVGLKQVAAETGGSRSVPSLASSLAWFGTGFGGLVMGRLADRFGIRATVMFGSASMAVGLLISSLGEPWHLYVGHGLFMGLLGNSGINAPLYIYVSRWFDRHRGSALALISSGSYVAGTVWPMIFERVISYIGWRSTMMWYALVEAAVIIPVAIIFLRPAPEVIAPVTAGGGSTATPRIFGWNPNLVFILLGLAGFCCCVTMSMPHAHLVALCTDLGISAAQGAAMLSLLLGLGFLCRQLWGVISDRIGALLTLLISGVAQMTTFSGFIVADNVPGLFAVSAAFGIAFSGLVPAYVLAVREYFPAREASWRVPALLLMSGSGMATGSWLAGVIYDHYAYYAPAFMAGVGFNLVNILLLSILVLRWRLTRLPRPQAA
jgi:MFS family permease